MFKFALLLPLAILTILAIPIFRNQVNAAWSRLETVENMFEENPTSDQMMARFTVRAPRVMDGFLSSSIVLGAGFSDLYYEFTDGHVGYQNILLNTGIIGILIFTFVIARLIVSPFRKGKIRSPSVKAYLKMSIVPVVLLLVINSATQTIGFLLAMDRSFLMGFAIILIGMAIKIDYLEKTTLVMETSD